MRQRRKLFVHAVLCPRREQASLGRATPALFCPSKAGSSRLPHGGKLFVHAVLCSRREQASLGRATPAISCPSKAGSSRLRRRRKLFVHAVLCSRREQASFGRAQSAFFVRQKQARVGCAKGASYSCTQCFAPAGSKPPSGAHNPPFLSVKNKPASVAARRQAIRARSALLPQGASLLRARHARHFLPVKSRLESVAARRQAIRARSALPPQGASLLRARNAPSPQCRPRPKHRSLPTRRKPARGRARNTGGGGPPVTGSGK